MKLVIAAVVAVVALRGTAHAGSLADAIARHAPADVDALRAQLPGDPAIRCTLGAVYAKRNELPRAAIYLAECDEAQLPPEIGAPIAKLALETKRKLRDSDLAVLEIVTKPAGMMAEIAALPGDQLVTPATVWIPAGSYDVKATRDGHTITNHVATTAHSRSVLIMEDAAPSAKPVKAGKADFTNETEPSERHVGPPAAIKHGSMMTKKQLGIADPANAGPQLDDPLAHVEDPPPAAPPTWRIGARAGYGGWSVSGRGAIGPSLALEAHHPLTDGEAPFELLARVDWRRGTNDDAGAAYSLGGAAGASKVLLAPDTAWISVGAALRAERNFAGGNENALAADAMIELALRRLPIVIGARFEQGLTTTLERAVIVELGFDLRMF